MKIPVCPRCKQPRTLKLTETYSDDEPIMNIRCFEVHGGCGALYTVLRFAVMDNSGQVDLYREETDPEIKQFGGTPKKWSKSSVLSNVPLRERKP